MASALAGYILQLACVMLLDGEDETRSSMALYLQASTSIMVHCIGTNRGQPLATSGQTHVGIKKDR